MTFAFRTSLLSAALAACAVGCGQPAPPPTPIATPAAVERQAVQTERSVPQMRAPGGAAVSIPARHDLAVDEALGGHTLERHVGRTDEQLRERLRREPNISVASTYTDRETAEQVIARAFEESATKVDRWESRTGRRPNLVLDHTERDPIGRSLRRSARTVSPCDHAVVVMRWDERRSRSYVLTSYPECGR